jgi:hypothetical protein
VRNELVSSRPAKYAVIEPGPEQTDVRPPSEERAKRRGKGADSGLRSRNRASICDRAKTPTKRQLLKAAGDSTKDAECHAEQGQGGSGVRHRP